MPFAHYTKEAALDLNKVHLTFIKKVVPFYVNLIRFKKTSFQLLENEPFKLNLSIKLVYRQNNEYSK